MDQQPNILLHIYENCLLSPSIMHAHETHLNSIFTFQIIICILSPFEKLTKDSLRKMKIGPRLSPDKKSHCAKSLVMSPKQLQHISEWQTRETPTLKEKKNKSDKRNNQRGCISVIVFLSVQQIIWLLRFYKVVNKRE